MLQATTVKSMYKKSSYAVVSGRWFKESLLIVDFGEDWSFRFHVRELQQPTTSCLAYGSLTVSWCDNFNFRHKMWGQLQDVEWVIWGERQSSLLSTWCAWVSKNTAITDSWRSRTCDFSLHNASNKIWNLEPKTAMSALADEPPIEPWLIDQNHLFIFGFPENLGHEP